MNDRYKFLKRTCIFLFLAITTSGFQEITVVENQKIELFKQYLSDLSSKSNDQLFTKHLSSIQQILKSKTEFSNEDLELIEKLYDSFLNDSLANPSSFKSYTSRQRMLILAWVSPTDSSVSFAWLRLPKNWNPEKEYPMYVQLHGHWDVAAEQISFMSFTFLQKPMTSFAFEDGYFLAPWGRGNQWYHGISKTDIWESIGELEKHVRIDSSRKYLCGHSMGGYGTWHIAQESAEIWAGIGIHSGALWYRNAKYIKQEYAERLKNTPAYFFWGNQEKQLKILNIKAHSLLQNAGNPNLKISVFEGGHDYNEEDVEDMYNWLRQFEKE